MGHSSTKHPAVSLVVAAHFTQIHVILGGFGVTIFFAISGFIITRLLLGELERTTFVNLVAFYKRRAFRLFPAIILSIIAAAAAQGMLDKDWVTWDRAMASVLFFQNYYIAGLEGFPGPLSQHWSLSVEEHFYLVFPIALVGLSTLGWRKTLVGMPIICLVSLCFRIWYVMALEPLVAEDYMYVSTECRIENILWGCILAVVAHEGSFRHIVKMVTKPAMFWLAVAVILAGFIIRDDFFRMTIRYSLQGAALAVIMAHILFAERAPFLRWVLNLPPVVWIGRLSFSIYLLHFTALHVAAHFLPWEVYDWQAWPFAVALTLFASWASYALVEQPMIRLGKRLKVRIQVQLAEG